MKKTLFLFILILGLANFSLAAEEEADEIVVTATKTPQKLKETTEKTVVVTQKQIQRIAPTSTIDLLKTIPGLYMQNHSASSGSTLIRIRGLDAKYVSILIDGVPVRNRLHDALPIELIPLSQIERIEIIKGSASTLYGSDAIAGVINIITKKPKKDKISLDLTQTGYTTGQVAGDLSAAFRNDMFSLMVFGGYDYYGGKKDDDTYLIRKSDQKNVGIDLGFFASENTKISLKATALYIDSEYDYSYSTDKFYIADKTKYDAVLRVSHVLNSDLKLDLISAYENYTYGTKTKTISTGTSTERTEEVLDVLNEELRLKWSIQKNINLLLGYNLSYESLEAKDKIGGDGSKGSATHNGYAQFILNFLGTDKLIITPGLRYTYNSDFDGYLSPKIGVRYNFIKEVGLKASYAYGYKIPTLKQRYMEWDHSYYMIYGNEDLEPEKSKSFDVALVFNPFKELHIEGGYFYTKIKNAITTQSSGGSNYQYYNAEDAYVTGAEIDVKGTILNDFSYSIGYVYQIAKEKASGETEYEDMTLRAKHSVTTNLSYMIPSYKTAFNFNFIFKDKQRKSTSSDEKTPYYQIMAFNLQQPLKDFISYDVTVFAGIKNILNEKHEDFSTYNGRYYYLGVRASF